MTSRQPGQRTRDQGIRYLVFGAFNTIATYGAYCLLVFVLHPQIAYAVAFIAGIALAYIGNSRFVFRRALIWKTARRYPFVYLAQYVLNAGLIYLLDTWLGLGPRLALAIALVITTPASFLFNRMALGRAEHPGGVPR